MSSFNDRVTAFRENLETNMEFLQENLSSLYDGGDRNFAENLCSWYESKGFLSDKQVNVAAKFFEEVGGKLESPEPFEDRQQHTTIGPAKRESLPPRVVVNGLPLVTLFDTAAKFLQRPKIVYKIHPPVHGIENLVFYRTTERSHAPNSVGVVNGAEAPDNRILATIYRDKPTAFYTFIFDKPEIQQLIKKIAENPQEELRWNGVTHVRCCYCARPLTDPRSIDAGYGPVCAERWGLEWGSQLPQLRLTGV